jgi:hypothetical protein
MKVNKIKDLKLEIEKARNEIDFLNSIYGIYDEFNEEEIDNRIDVLRFIIFDSYVNMSDISGIKLRKGSSMFKDSFVKRKIIHEYKARD